MYENLFLKYSYDRWYMSSIVTSGTLSTLFIFLLRRTIHFDIVSILNISLSKDSACIA